MLYYTSMKTHLTTLNIDLSTQENSFVETAVSELTLEETLGGFGRAIHDTDAHLKQHPDLTDAYDPRNMIGIDIGFLVGGNKLATAYRTKFTGLSPMKTSKAGTNGIYYSASSGMLGPALRQNNLDSIRIFNESKTPVYMLIENGKPILKEADFLIGKSTSEKIEA